MESEYAQGLNAENKAQYFKKLTLPSEEVLPDPYLLCNWSNDISKVPEISWRDVREYLIDTPSVYTKEALKAYKSLEAYDYFVCGHVQSCFYHEISKDNRFCFIKSEVSLNIGYK